MWPLNFASLDCYVFFLEYCSQINSFCPIMWWLLVPETVRIIPQRRVLKHKSLSINNLCKEAVYIAYITSQIDYFAVCKTLPAQIILKWKSILLTVNSLKACFIIEKVLDEESCLRRWGGGLRWSTWCSWITLIPNHWCTWTRVPWGNKWCINQSLVTGCYRTAFPYDAPQSCGSDLQVKAWGVAPP